MIAVLEAKLPDNLVAISMQKLCSFKSSKAAPEAWSALQEPGAGARSWSQELGRLEDFKILFHEPICGYRSKYLATEAKILF